MPFQEVETLGQFKSSHQCAGAARVGEKVFLVGGFIGKKLSAATVTLDVMGKEFGSAKQFFTPVSKPFTLQYKESFLVVSILTFIRLKNTSMQSKFLFLSLAGTQEARSLCPTSRSGFMTRTRTTGRRSHSRCPPTPTRGPT